MTAVDAKADPGPRYGYTVGDQDRAPCPWCSQPIVLESEEMGNGIRMDCPYCDRPLRMETHRRVTIRLYPVKASSEDSRGE